MAKHLSEGRSIWCITVSVIYLFFFSVCYVLVTEKQMQWGFSSVWTSFSGAIAASTTREQKAHQEDDPSCLSRTQQSIYRPPSKVLPIPPRLEEEWKKYGELHRSCSLGKNWTDFFLKGESDGCSYLLYMEGGEGLGNRILSLVTAFTYALATNRVLLIDSRKNLAKLLCEPFPGSSWVLPGDFPYDEVKNSSLGPLVRNYQFNSSIVSLNLQHTMNSQDRQFFCEETYSSLKNVRWVVWTSNQYYLTNLFLVPSFWHRMKPLFHDIKHIFTLLSRLLLLPANDTWALVLREYRSYLSCSSSRVGVQVRLHGHPNLAAFNIDANQRVMECLVDNNLLPNVSSTENITELAMYSRKEQSGKDSADIVVLLASLQGKYFEKMKELYSQQPTVDARMVRVHSVSQQGRQDHGFHQAQLAFAEMWLLSYSDHLATSGYSTFGYIAQGLGGQNPYILRLRKDDLRPACVVGQSVEPCTHYPKRPDCLGAKANLTAEHKEWIKRHVRNCQDHVGGWQLVEGDGAAAPILFDFLASSSSPS